VEGRRMGNGKEKEKGIRKGKVRK
jgi:hypothetical protein